MVIFIIIFKGNIQNALKNKGITLSALKNKKILPGAVITKIHKNDPMIFNVVTIDKICALLSCQPGDILEYVLNDNNIDQVATAETYKSKVKSWLFIIL